MTLSEGGIGLEQESIWILADASNLRVYLPAIFVLMRMRKDWQAIPTGMTFPWIRRHVAHGCRGVPYAVVVTHWAGSGVVH